VDAAELAKQAGHLRTVNMVMVGAASPFLPVPAAALENTITAMFASKGPDIAAANSKAFHIGRETAASN
jgi:indolepyruvate ferredoxin oxidoreductase beta subunit